MNKYINITLYLFVVFFSLSGIAQTANTGAAIDTFATYSISAYTDVYYAGYTDNTPHGSFVKFPTVSPRNNSVGLNDLQVSFRYDGEKIRGVATLQYGDIAQSSWSKTYNNIQEAHAGVRLSKTLWLDGGFFKSHFGTENLLPVDNIASALATPTYYECYYEAGLRLNYDPTTQLEINLFLLNGYNMFEDNNNRKSFGMGITYSINDHAGVGYTNYIGNDAPDSVTLSHRRVAQNVFFNYHKGKICVQAGGDLYIQQHAGVTDSNKTAIAFAGLLTIAYKLPHQMQVYARGEVFNDADAFLSTAITDTKQQLTGYKLYGVTAGIAYKPVPNAYVRLEGRRLQMAQNQDIFEYNGQYRDYRYEVMVTAGISFSLLKGVETRY
ncbi:MAG: outer membrane beta-barrel protein [Flavipsychrobacter sp.]|nr:outer membrane beta-barrel protein [Flavipsychrobacter sp.]